MADSEFRENLRGIVAMTACNFLFLINDTALKLASGDMPLTQMLFLRAMFAVPILVIALFATGTHRRFRTLSLSWPLFWRTFGEILAAYSFLMALFHIPIANANTIAQVVPLAITAAGAIFLGERVGWRRWAAIVVGFIGVLIVIRPGFEGFDAYSLLVLGSVVGVTIRDMATRAIRQDTPALFISIVTGVAVGISGPIFALVLGDSWSMPSTNVALLIFVSAVFLCGGYITSVFAMRHGDISVIAPFRYTVIVFAIIIGFVIWREVPDTWMIVGTLIIAATGVYTFSRERNLSRLRAEAEAGQGL